MPSDSAASRDIPFLVIERVLPLLKSPPAGLLPVGIAVDFAESDPARPAVRLLDASQQQIAEKATLLIGPWSQLEDKHPAATVDAICSAFPGIRTVHVGQAGIEHVAAAPCFKRGVKLTNARGTTSIPIAEFVMMFMLNHAKRAQEFLALPAPTPASEAPTPYAPEPLAVRSATPFWTNGKKLSLSELFDKTVFILGLGNIGKEVARRCSAGFGMRVWGAKRTAEPVDNVDRVFNSDDWKFPEVLGEVDYFVIAAPASESTTEILNSETLGRLKKGAYIVNVGRGSLISTTDLLAALDSSHIAGAALDVTDPDEPLSTYSPLWKYYPDRIWITPHQAWSSERTLQRVVEMMVDEVRRDAEGRESRNVVAL